ncbi:MAG: hypothetical protein FJ202_02330 [Gemmatimonadetes bacterium]|nr:hypothetical protein [Gemmatimonadota bacterium]
MSSAVSESIAAVVREYRRTADVSALLAALDRIARESETAALMAAVAPHRDLHEVCGPVYEVIVEREPTNATALVALANAYWLTGRGPEVVAGLADRARSADPTNRAAWHLWALAESSPRERTSRWRVVTQEFPDDELAQVNLADNAAALAGAENDPVALKLALATYETLLARATRGDQRAALERAVTTLRNWRG